MLKKRGPPPPAQKFFFSIFFQPVKKLINFGNFVKIKVAKLQSYIFLIGQSEKSGIEINGTPCMWQINNN